MPSKKVPQQLTDFRNFLYLVWIHLNLPSPTEVQYDVAYYLQHGPRRLVVEAFRGVGKSWITAAYVCWVLLMNPQRRVMVVSASKERADAFSVFVKRLIQDLPILNHLKPREGQRDSSLIFDVGPAKPDQSPSVKSVGITGQITGSRADLIVADDIETPKNSLTQTMRDRLAELVKEFDAVIKPEGSIVYLGTPQTEMSLYNRLPERGYQIRVWPARYRKELTSHGLRLAPMIQAVLDANPKVIDDHAGRGGLVDPLRFDDDDLVERELSYGRSGFAMQFQLDTSMADKDRYPLKLSDLMVMGLDLKRGPVSLSWGSGPDLQIQDIPCSGLDGDRYHRPIFVAKEFAEWTGSVMWIDPSGRGKDETAYAIVKMLHGRLYLTAIGGYRDGYSEQTLKALAVHAKTHGVNFIGVESNFGDGMFTQLFKPILSKIHPCEIEETRAQGQKELRIIDTLEPVMNQHRLVVDQEVIRKDFTENEDTPWFSLFYQMTRITKDRGALKHDDRLDALEGAVKYWTEQLAVDADDAAQSHREEQLDQDLRKFMEHALGASATKDTYI